MMHSFMKDVKAWVLDTFGDESLRDRRIRSHRFIEECIELVQACDIPKSEVQKIVDYVYSRPKGVMTQEVGGVMVTFAAHANSFDYDPELCGMIELGRCWKEQKAIAKKNSKKPKL